MKVGWVLTAALLDCVRCVLPLAQRTRPAAHLWLAVTFMILHWPGVVRNGDAAAGGAAAGDAAATGMFVRALNDLFEAGWGGPFRKEKGLLWSGDAC